MKKSAWILPQEYIGKSKDDEPKKMVRTIGYYGSMTEAVKKYIMCICDSVTASSRITWGIFRILEIFGSNRKYF